MLSDREYALLGAALRRAEREGLSLPSDRNRRKATTLTEKHRSKDFDKPTPANPVGIAVLRFLMLTGWREKEALSLCWTNLNLERGTVTLPNTKTGRSERELGAPALEVIEAMRAWRLSGNAYVFPGAKRGAHFTDTARIWNCVREAAGLSDVRLHDLRHGYASVGLSSGLTLPVIGALLAHADVATTARYPHLADSSRNRAADLTSGAVAIALLGDAESDKLNEELILTSVPPFRRPG